MPSFTKSYSQIDKRVLENTEVSTKFRDGRYEVAIPWKEHRPELTENYDMALRRLENTEKKLAKNPEIAQMYHETIEKYVEKGYVQEVPSTDPKSDNVWYLPHFPVVRPEKETTKVRIVFDASAKNNDVSLNDAIEQGPKLQLELFDVLLRFRKNPVAIMCERTEVGTLFVIR